MENDLEKEGNPTLPKEVKKEEKEKAKAPNPFIGYVKEHTHKGSEDELLDVRIGNPLRKITELLEDIKKQKAFTFSLKGSIGIMGVVLVGTTLGVLGGTRLLCDKGVQTKQGVVQVLFYKENSEPTILSYIPIVSEFIPERRIDRKVLLTPQGEVIHLLLKRGVDAVGFDNQNMFVTGSYDSCSERLTVSTQEGFEASQ